MAFYDYMLSNTVISLGLKNFLMYLNTQEVPCSWQIQKTEIIVLKGL